MNKEQKIVFIQSQIVCAMTEAMGMEAENMSRYHRGEAMAYPDTDFFGLHEKYGITGDAVREFLKD